MNMMISILSCIHPTTTTTTTTVTNDNHRIVERKKKKSTRYNYVRRVIIVGSIELLLFLLLLFYAIILWCNYVYDQYIIPQVIQQQHQSTSSDRSITDMTYYYRECMNEHDMSTTNPMDLMIVNESSSSSSNSSTINNKKKKKNDSDYYLHQIKHGFTQYKNVLSISTSNTLREYIIQERNQQIQTNDIVPITKLYNRYSIGLTSTEHIIVRTALIEIGTNQQLQQSIIAVLGPNPAMIELAAITSTYGAPAQDYHSDVPPHMGTTLYSNHYLSAYSIFIQLQNTTKDMGSTHICPGTHYCVIGPIPIFCHTHGFQVTTNVNNTIWEQGDAILMNQNSWHRGEVHINPNNHTERVMLVLTFVSNPYHRSNPPAPAVLYNTITHHDRQLPQGNTYFTRFYMWGHTWIHLQYAHSTMIQPWVTLRALGLYNHHQPQQHGSSSSNNSNHWGIDYISYLIMQLKHTDSKFKNLETIQTFIQNGGITVLPIWLQHFNTTTQWDNINLDDDENNTDSLDPISFWMEYIHGTKEKCINFIKHLCIYIICGYIICITLIGTSIISQNNNHHHLATSTTTTTNTTTGIRFFRNGCIRILLIISFIYILLLMAKHHVDETIWAKDIITRYKQQHRHRRHRRGQYSHPENKNNNNLGPTTFPTSYDVLIETKYGSEPLAMYNDFIRLGHPGNVLFQTYIDTISPFYVQYDETFQFATIQFIISTISSNHGRFLYQRYDGSWLWTDTDFVRDYIRDELIVASNNIIRPLIQTIRYIVSNNKFSTLGHSAFVIKHSIPHIERLKRRILDTVHLKASTVQVYPRKKNWMLLSSHSNIRSMQQSKKSNNFKRTTTQLNIVEQYKEPFIGAWIADGDFVETYEDDEWYVGVVHSVRPDGRYKVEYVDTTTASVNQFSIRPFHNYQIGETVNCYIYEFDERMSCTIRDISKTNMLYNVTLHDGQKHYQVQLSDLSRNGPRIRTKYIREESEDE